VEVLPRLGALARHFGLVRFQALHPAPATIGHVRAVFREVGSAGLMHRLPRGDVLWRSRGSSMAMALAGRRQGLRQRRPGDDQDGRNAKGSKPHDDLPEDFGGKNATGAAAQA
jgi:hypothetical protein